jgi:MFS family permease
VPLTLLLLQDSPARLGVLPDGLTRDPSTDEPPPGTPPPPPPERQWTFGQAAGTLMFWVIMLSGALSLFTLRLVTVHQVSYLVDIGITRATSAAVFGSSGLTTALAFIYFGRLSDRIGRELAFSVGAIAQVIALALLLIMSEVTPLALLWLYALLWGIGEGSRSGLLTATANDAFPGPAQGIIGGTLSGFFGLGAASGSWVGGLVYDWSGSYIPALQIALAATVVASVGILVVRQLQRRATVI